MLASRRRFLLATAAATLPGCGTIMHYDRRNQPRSDKIDWGVFLGNTLLTLCFLPVGLIGFIIDFWNGTIYLPAENVATGEPILVPVAVPRDQMTREGLEAVLSEHFGQSISLADAEFDQQIGSRGEFFPRIRQTLGQMPRLIRRPVA